MKIWTTKDGTKIPYNELTESHIYNIIGYAQKHGFVDITISHSITDNMDGVIIYKDSSNEVIKDMLTELKRRKHEKRN